jgi:hypothetical protein
VAKKETRKFGAWNLVLGIWCLEFGAWCLEFGIFYPISFSITHPGKNIRAFVAKTFSKKRPLIHFRIKSLLEFNRRGFKNSTQTQKQTGSLHHF